MKFTVTATTTCSTATEDPTAGTSSLSEDVQLAELEPPATEPAELEHSVIEPAEAEPIEFSSVGETSPGSIAEGSTSAPLLAGGSTSHKPVDVEPTVSSPGIDS